MRVHTHRDTEYRFLKRAKLMHFTSCSLRMCSSCHLSHSEPLRFCFNNFVLMKYPDGSAVRGFSLGATAGSTAPSCTIFLSVVSANLEVSFHGLSFVLDSKRVHGRWSYSWKSEKHGKSRLDIRVASEMNNYSPCFSQPVAQIFAYGMNMSLQNLYISDQGQAKPTSSFSLPSLCWLCWVLFCLPWHAMTKSCFTLITTSEEPWRGICGARRSRLNWMASTSFVDMPW